MANNAERNRFSIDLPPDYQTFLAHTARENKITQGDVVELLLKNMHKSVGIKEEFADRRNEKLQQRKQSKTALATAFASLSPEAQAAALAAVNGA